MSREPEGMVATDPALSAEAASRVLALPEVSRGGRFWVHRAGEVRRWVGGPRRTLPVVAADRAAAELVGARLARGRWPADAALAQAVITAPAARRLGLSPDVALPFALLVEGATISVVGVVAPDPARPEFSGVLYLSPETAVTSIAADDNAVGGYVLEAEPDDQPRVARAAPLAARPAAPGRVGVLLPPDPVVLRDLVEGRLRIVVFGVGAVAGVLGVVSVAVNSWTSVVERRVELATRMALGSTARRLGSEIVVEASLVGLAAGLLGVTAGLTGGVLFGALHAWPMAFSAWSSPLAVAAGVLAGALAGLVPARQTARVDPALVLRAP
ncbi:MAG: ABC transporter permease [Deltaproteobacteria bacterium]|nr:MAG: ABC transporter permease [Deltaproteobacteria bacterium]